MRVTLGQVRKLLREAQGRPDEEFIDLAREVVANLRDMYGDEAIWREMWRIEGDQSVFWAKVTSDTHDQEAFLETVVDSIMTTMKMITGDPSPFRDVDGGMGAIEAGDFRADLFIDPQDRDGMDVELTLKRLSETRDEAATPEGQSLVEGIASPTS